jgi:hypothetical protein
MSIKKNTARLGGAIALLFAHQLALAAPDMPAPLSSYYPDLGPNVSIVSEIHDGASIALIGLITPEASASVQAILAKKESIRALYIDSGGGDVAAAMSLAEVIRQRKLRLVVAGRCLSACANYLFTAALRKTVPPGSLVGIHGLSHHARLGDKILTMNARDKDKLIAAAGDPSLGAKIAVIERNERDFYAKFGISTQYFAAFNRYTAQSAAGSAGKCPGIDFWVLRRKDLENMGVTGMDAVWEPADQAMASKAAARLGLGTQAVFVGDPAALAARCKPASGLMAKLRGLFG